MLKNFFNFLIFSNLFISICAIGQVLLSFKLLHTPPQWSVVAFVGLSTLGMYNFSMVLSKPKSNTISSNQKAIWSFEHYKLMLIITILTFTLAGILFLTRLNRASQILMCIAGCISMLYNIPIISYQGKKIGLRNIPIIKVLLISFVWSLSCTALPMMAVDFHLMNCPSFLIRTVNSLLFITAITIPFDIRDMYQDTFYHMKTIPILIGRKKSFLLCYTLLLVNLILLWAFLPFEYAMHYSTTANVLLTAFLIHSTRLNKNYFYYFLLLDGTLLTQYIFVVILK